MPLTAWKRLLLAAGIGVTAAGAAAQAPAWVATIDTTSVATSTRYEPQRAVWQNPRGLHSFYAIIQRGAAGGLQLSESADGTPGPRWRRSILDDSRGERLSIR